MTETVYSYPTENSPYIIVIRTGNYDDDLTQEDEDIQYFMENYYADGKRDLYIGDAFAELEESGFFESASKKRCRVEPQLPEPPVDTKRCRTKPRTTAATTTTTTAIITTQT